MIIPGILASSKTGQIWAPSQDYVSISTATVTSGGQASITFSSIPTTFAHLQVRAMTVSTGSTSSSDDWLITANNDTTALYDTHDLYGNGSTVTAYGDTTSGSFRPTMFNRGITNGISVAIIDILDYCNTNKFKTFRALGGFDNNGSGTIGFSSGLWRNTNAINRLDFGNGVGSFNQYTVVSLYGVK